ncbi:MAG: alpha/beta hydrolase [Clostridia bacterium]|nr:alpha/beta hydrolase [Clostridia bacterium]
MKRESFVSHDGKTLSLLVWDEINNAKAVVQISHGMAEHAERYDYFATKLNEAGYVVIADDHRAHGKTDPDRLGKAEEGKNLFDDTVEDMKSITDMAKERYGLPVVLFGHSYGSFLSQAYIEKYSDDITACVLSGSALYGKLLATFGKFVAGRKAKKHPDEDGKFFAKITFESYDKKLGEGKNAWLSNSKESNEKYSADPLSGFTCSNAFYKYMFAGMKNLCTPTSNARTDLPIFLISGERDFVGNCGKLVKKLSRKYEKTIADVTWKEYPKARHELLNEPNKDEVITDVLAFIKRTTKRI